MATVQMKQSNESNENGQQTRDVGVYALAEGVRGSFLGILRAGVLGLALLRRKNPFLKKPFRFA